jgi:uncharacterized protein YkwD
MSEQFGTKRVAAAGPVGYHFPQVAVAGPLLEGVLMLRGALTFGLAIAVIGMGSSAQAAGVRSPDQSSEAASAESDLVAMINAYRAGNGLQALSTNGALAAAAAWMAGDMARKNYVGHVSSDGRSPTQRMSAFGYPATSTYTGEDLGAGYGTASAVLVGWQASAAHNAVLLNPNYDAIGVGLVYDPRAAYKWYWAADFGGHGGTAKVTIPATARAQSLAERADAAPRGPAPRSSDEKVDPTAATQVDRLAVIDRIVRLIARLFGILHRASAI